MAFTDDFASVVGLLLSLLAESTLFTLFVVDSIVDDLFSPDDFDAVIVVTLALLLLELLILFYVFLSLIRGEEY